MSTLLPYAYFWSSPPFGSPRHAMFHSVCAQRRLPCSSHTFFAYVGGVHTNGSSHGLFGNSNTSMQNQGSLPLIHTGTMLSAPHFSRCSGVWMTMSLSP